MNYNLINYCHDGGPQAPKGLSEYWIKKKEDTKNGIAPS